ncbi:DUF4097 family beta strand repeat-containing protein [Bacillus sp. Marseille-P3661]|uniref:DUF4097 family beta strand repeat-containing protein n=1 Tax=Bacillus sp. Marseille-P3661 TaxID=1936234 RepID=UPI000C843FD4|nr:DUF4097 domain-containing protein [Bacillus sp. Marseille-P3661]
MIEERKRILKMVEEGKLTAEEAIMLLEKLESPKTESKQTATNPSTFVKYDSNYKDYKQSYKNSGFKEKFSGFFESAFKKIKEVDLDFNFGPHHEVNHIFQHRDIILSNLNVDISNGEIELKPWDEQEVRIECRAKVYKAESHEEAKNEFLKQVQFAINENSLKFEVEPKNIKLNTIFYVPRSSYENILIRMFNGQIALDELNVKVLKATTANGNITVNHVSAEDLEFETANGHIKVENSYAQAIEAETLNGTITAKGSFGKTDLQSFSSSIICHLEDPNCETVLLKTKTGSIKLFVPTEVEVNGIIRSNIGGFSCELNQLEVFEEKREVVQKEMRFAANRGRLRKLDVEAESRAGSISIKSNQ